MNVEIYFRENNLFKKIIGLGEDKCIFVWDILMIYIGCELWIWIGNMDEIVKYLGFVCLILCFEDLFYCSWKVIFFFFFIGI